MHVAGHTLFLDSGKNKNRTWTQNAPLVHMTVPTTQRNGIGLDHLAHRFQDFRAGGNVPARFLNPQDRDFPSDK
jgi:hypothetical protein